MLKMMETKKHSKFCSIAAVAVATLMVVAALALPLPAAAEDSDHAAHDAGVGLATVVANLFYVPVKLAYATLGGLTGSIAYGLTGGNREVANNIWIPSVSGDYVLSPEMVEGSQPVYFSGLRFADAGLETADQVSEEDTAAQF